MQELQRLLPNSQLDDVGYLIRRAELQRRDELAQKWGFDRAPGGQAAPPHEKAVEKLRMQVAQGRAEQKALIHRGLVGPRYHDEL